MILYDAQDNAYIASKANRPRLWSPRKCWDFEKRRIDGDPDAFDVANFFTARSAA